LFKQIKLNLQKFTTLKHHVIHKTHALPHYLMIC